MEGTLRSTKTLFLLLAFLFFASSTWGAEEEPIRLDLRLMASDLIDDVVYSWLQSRPVPGSGPTNLIVAEIQAPVGIDTRFEQDMENHLFEDLRANPQLPIKLVHCSLCRQWVTVSNPKRTVMARTLSLPEGREELAQYPHLNALSLHFDVIGRDLVLWAEIYEVAPPQRVLWAQRYSHSTSARSVLRDPNHLVSIGEAREEQKRLIAGRETIQAVTRFPIRTFAGKKDNRSGANEISPLIFLEQSFESVLSPRRNRRAGLSVGVTSIKGSMQGWSFGASFAQLLFRNEPSLTEPDVYVRAAVNYLRLEGSGAAVFSKNQIDVNKLINSGDDPRASLTAFQLGLEAHVKYRFGFNVFFEYIPVLDSSPTIETRKEILIPIHSIGVAGVFLW